MSFITHKIKSVKGFGFVLLKIIMQIISNLGVNSKIADLIKTRK
ncbi:MAG: hypothetical protein PV340_05245 [Wolbachia sp.]|nr:hypothetical protein [Wolbachia sp.]